MNLRGNVKITDNDNVLKTPPQNPILHGKTLQIQILDKSDQWLEISGGHSISHWNDTTDHINGVLMCTILPILKISIQGSYLKLVKDTPRKFQNSYFICGRLFGILRSVRFQKILGNQQYGWGFRTPLKMDVMIFYDRGENPKHLIRSVMWTRCRNIGTDKEYINEYPKQAP